MAMTGFEHVPSAGLQMPAAWHWSVAGQALGVPHIPSTQTSFSVHGLLSLHAVVSALRAGQKPVDFEQVPVWWQSVSVEHAVAVPGVQTPA